MDIINDGGPAFPIVESDAILGTRVTGGLTVRDKFAESAMLGILSGGVWCTDFEETISCAVRTEDGYCWDNEKHPKQIAKMAYYMADAMIAERTTTTSEANR